MKDEKTGFRKHINTSQRNTIPQQEHFVQGTIIKGMTHTRTVMYGRNFSIRDVSY
jgi:hypothetical protein